MRNLIVFLCVLLIAGSGVARISPFFPSVTSKDTHLAAEKYPFDAYSVMGYVSGPDKTYVLIKTPDNTVITLMPGHVLGQEKFTLARIKQGNGVSFTKTVTDMNGKETTLHKTKEITGQ